MTAKPLSKDHILQHNNHSECPFSQYLKMGINLQHEF